MKKLDLNTFPYYYKGVQKAKALANPNPKGLLKMKLAIRIFALSVVLVGVAAASVSSSSSSRTMASHQAATAGVWVGAGGCVQVVLSALLIQITIASAALQKGELSLGVHSPLAHPSQVQQDVT